MIKVENQILEISISDFTRQKTIERIERLIDPLIVAGASLFSIAAYFVFLINGLGLAYNDARSHLDIARRVVEGLKPGLAQLGSVWLPLPHFLMIPLVVNETFWHTGFAGAIVSMISYVLTVFFLVKILKLLNIGSLGRITAATIFVLNLNALYLQSTAMTELLLIATMTAGTYYLVKWAQNHHLGTLIAAAAAIFASTLVRYDGWFLLAISAPIVGIISWQKLGKRSTEGMIIFFLTLAGFGIVLWFLWNALIFNDPLYFAFGPYSARAQQAQVEAAGQLITKGHLLISLKTYWYALTYNIGLLSLIIGAVGTVIAYLNFRKNWPVLLALSTLFAPIVFNVIALYFGHSILFVPPIAGDTWFNVRYGIIGLPAAALFIGILVDKLPDLRWVIISLLIFVGIFSWANADAVTIDDAKVGASQKNVSQVSNWLYAHAKDNHNEVLISAASHDAIIFSSGLPMKRFIHEGTGSYWESATRDPSHWVRYIVMRTNDVNDQTFELLNNNPQLVDYDLVVKGDFADIYELKEQYRNQLPQTPLAPLKK